MTEDPRKTIEGFRTKVEQIKAKMLENRILSTIPTIFELAGYYPGMYTINSVTKVEGQDGDYLEIQVTLISGSPETMDSLTSGLNVLLQQGARAERVDNTIFIRLPLI